jgi:hypothetical protein
MQERWLEGQYVRHPPTLSLEAILVSLKNECPFSDDSYTR